MWIVSMDSVELLTLNKENKQQWHTSALVTSASFWSVFYGKELLAA